MIVLDTHVLVWWVNGDDSLSRDAQAAIDRELDGGTIAISSITAWEIAMLVRRDKLRLSMDMTRWLDTVGDIEAVQFVPVDNVIALDSVALPGDFHNDPADRMIVATARALGAALVTKDQKIRDYAHVKTVW